MAEDRTMNKLIVSEEAKFDFERLTDKTLPTSSIKREVEEYFEYIKPKLNNSYYFRIKYALDEVDKMLMFYIYKDKKFGNMQLWRLQGVSYEEDWTEELEDDGQIRFWLKTKIKDLPEEIDWVVRYRLWKEGQDKLKELDNEH